VSSLSRSEWVDYADRLARPVLEAAAAGSLSQAATAEHHRKADPDRLATASLEAFGRLLAGLAPWFETAFIGASPRSAGPVIRLSQEEARPRDDLHQLAAAALVHMSDPASPSYLGFAGTQQQTLVDAAFLAHGFLRSPGFWYSLDPPTRRRLVEGFMALRNRKPGFNNWLLFSAMTESFLLSIDEAPDLMRIDFALRQHEQWYLGDGTYSDGPAFHADYYNSYVIHPMLTDILTAVAGHDPAWDAMRGRQQQRLARAAEIQERMISADGSWPVLGRSIAYRCGAFQTLAQAALLQSLPENLPAAQVRCALAAAISRSLGPEECWRADGFLAIGLAGHQPSLGEPYITTGSLYLAATALLPLGLSPDDVFWRDDDLPWTSVRAFDLKEDLEPDHAGATR
jgi:hypothetical protein